MDVTQLTTTILQTMDAAVEFTEYALAQVLIPDEYAHRFNDQSELLLAFDYEVAQENPDAEFVTFGSGILETLFDISISKPVSDNRHVIVDRIEIANPEVRINHFLQPSISGRFSVELLSQRPVMGIWGGFTFRTNFLSNESFEESRTVWVNMITGDLDILLPKVSLFFEEKPIYDYPYIEISSFDKAYISSRSHIEEVAQEIANATIPISSINQETERLQAYYAELITENQRRLSRKGVTAEKQVDILQKSEALEREMDRQINEIKENMTPKPMINIEHGIILHIPIIELVCNIVDRNTKKEQIFYYECLTKQLLSTYPLAGS